MTCPKCGKHRAHRVLRRGWLDNSANWLLMKPYVCDSCSHRFRALQQGGGHPGLAEQIELRFAEARRGKAGRWVRKSGILYYLAAAAVMAGLLRVIFTPR